MRVCRGEPSCYAAGLTIFGAGIVGILPALRVTRVNIQDMLRSQSAGRTGGGLRFGGFWTAVIIVQVAITVAFIPLAAGGVFEANRFDERADAIGAERFLAAHVAIDRDDLAVDSATYVARVRNSFDALEARLSAEPGVERVAFADRLPVKDQLEYGFAVDTSAGAPGEGLRVSPMTYVSRGYFGAFGASIIAGRDFLPSDFERLGGRALIVNEAFARNVFGRSNRAEGEVSERAKAPFVAQLNRAEGEVSERAKAPFVAQLNRAEGEVSERAKAPFVAQLNRAEGEVSERAKAPFVAQLNRAEGEVSERAKAPFVAQLNPVGQRVRLVSYNSDETLFGVDTAQWLEIVGVVGNFGWQPPLPEDQIAMYRPTLGGDGPASSLALRVRDPNAFASRLRTIAAEIDPMIRLTGVQQLGAVSDDEARISWTLTAVAWLVGFIVLMLSATGIHALMSFTVARRTREIGIRAALGANHRRLVAAIFSRAFLQIGAGIVVGSSLAALAGFGSTKQVVLLIAADAIMLVVGLAACAVPVRRALRIDPMEALRAE